MQASLLELLTSPHFADAAPGLSESALVALEEALGAALPAAALGSTPAVDAPVLAAPANWPAPDGTRDLRPNDLTDEV